MKVTSYRELTDQQAKAAVAISGAHHSSWNGRQQDTDPAKKVRGSAGWDGTVSYSRRLVTEPVQEMFRNARAYNQDPATLQSYREAVKTMLHENVHLLAAEGGDHGQAVSEIDKPGVRPFEEGITELYSQQKLNDYIDELGLEEIAPGIREADAVKAYPKYLPAADAFTDTIARDSRLDKADVVSRLAIVTADQKFRVAAETIYDNSKLPQLVPSDQREASVRRIEAAMKQPFSEVNQVSDIEPMRRRESAKVGARAAAAGYREAGAIQQQWTMPAPEQQRSPRSQESQQTRSTNAPEAQEARSAGADPAQEANGVAATEVQGTRGTTEVQEAGGESEVRSAQPAGVGGGARAADLQNAMRTGLSGAPPLSGASRLSEGEQGSRRGGSQPAQQRQGSEREA